MCQYIFLDFLALGRSDCKYQAARRSISGPKYEPREGENMKLTAAILLLSIFTLFTFDINAQPGRSTVAVRIHNEKNVPRAGFRIKFVEMVDDSRCPVDTNCIWAGNAKVRIEVRETGRRGETQTFELNSNTQPTSVRFKGYEIKLIDMTPHPQSNIRINRNGFVAKFEIRRVGR